MTHISLELAKCKSGFKHGGRSTPLYAVWASMKARCMNPKCSDYSRYGSRGIGVCEEWREFDGFRVWANKVGYRRGLTLDRKDNDGNYCPENCKWSTMKEQSNNRSNSLNIAIGGKIQTFAQWCEELGVNYFTVYYYVKTKKLTPQAAIERFYVKAHSVFANPKP